MNLQIFIILVIAIHGFNCTPGPPDRNKLKEIYHWDIIDYELPSGVRQKAIESGSFIPNKNAILSVAAWRNKMFVAVSRFTNGIGSSLNYFSLNTTDKSPILIPYPSFDANFVNEDPNERTVSLPSPSSVINSGHFQIDKCDRLWVIDSGIIDRWGTKRSIAPPAIVIFDLTTDTLIRRIEIPDKFVNPVSNLGGIVVDIENSCDDVHAYVPDMFRNIIVYSFKKNHVWIVEHSFMGSNPHDSNLVYEHLNFQWNFGILALAVGSKQTDGSKPVYFSPVASTKMYYVSNRVLQNEEYTQQKYFYDFHLLGDIGKDGHAAQMVYDDTTDVLFNTLYCRSTLGCWNSRLPYHSQVDVIHKNTELFYPIGLSIDVNRNLWVLSNRLPLNFYESFKANVKNMRIFKETVDEAITGTNCAFKVKQ